MHIYSLTEHIPVSFAVVLSCLALLLPSDRVPASELHRQPDSFRLVHPRIPSQARKTEAVRRDRTVNILALRVEFVRDTLSTTSGDGTFDYSSNDTIYFDPPPHNSLYFADQLEFNRFYWDKMSNGAVDITWDIYPVETDTAYQLPKKMWQYNYNYPVEDNPDHLDRGLANLFYDAIQAAVEDTSIHWRNYDLVILFHAGAGTEFDLGFTETPHDIPSAWMVLEDFKIHLGLENGILVDDHGIEHYIKEGLILPETESHDDVQIAMNGVVVFLFGHWLGLPALYDRDDGRAVVGKWSLLDRGFGNFYGAIPGPMDAWSRSYMGWLEPTELLPGDSPLKTNKDEQDIHDILKSCSSCTSLSNNSPIKLNKDRQDIHDVSKSCSSCASLLNTVFINAYGFETPGAIDAGKIRITDQEYFLLECRLRDPDNDSIAVAFDREGRRMVFNNDYSVNAQPGFRVPVWIDDLDFDTPGSGILIWQVDEALEVMIDEGRFNSINIRRGLDLEEADGAQDIGQDYPFLTPGWGTDYGIFEDAWYFDNYAHQDANGGRAVSFSDHTYPNCRSNSGAFTLIALSNFSTIDTLMSFKLSQTGWKFDSPLWHGLGNKMVAVGNFDNTPEDQEIILFGNDRLMIIDGNGEIIDSVLFNDEYNHSNIDPLVRDLDNDGHDEVVWVGKNGDEVRLYLLNPNHAGEFQLELIDSFITSLSNIAFGGSEDQTMLLVTQEVDRIDNETISLIKSYDSAFNLVSEDTLTGSNLSLHRFGSAQSDTFLIIADGYKIFLWNQQELDSFGLIFPEEDPFRSITDGPFLVDFDRNGQQDVVLIYEEWGASDGPEDGQFMEKRAMLLVRDVGYNNEIAIQEYTLDSRSLSIGKTLPVDVDQDGCYELVGFLGWEIFGNHSRMLALENNSEIVEGFPWHIDQQTGHVSISSFIIPDLNGDGKLEYQYISSLTSISTIDKGGIYLSRSLFTHSSSIEIKDHRGENLTGFPVASRLYNPSCRLCQLDDDPWFELLMVTSEEFDVYDFEFSGNGEPSIWWGQQYRDNDHSNAIWEPATPFSPANASTLLPDDLCYNWPNPARNETYIRYFLNFDAAVDVDIFDIMGEKVTSFHRPNQSAGLPHEIPWLLKGIARGAYFAVVKAEGAGKSETKLIKIAVVK